VPQGIGVKPVMITEVFRRLPDKGHPFSQQAREKWMTALKARLDLECSDDADSITPKRPQ